MIFITILISKGGKKVDSLPKVNFLRRGDQSETNKQFGPPPIWEDMTMIFAAKFLDLPSLPQGSRQSHYEKLRHERHWTVVGHNSSTARKPPHQTSVYQNPY